MRTGPDRADIRRQREQMELIRQMYADRVREQDELVTVGEIRRVNARNFRVAVYLGGGRWLGVRQKFDDRYLFMEDVGTVRAVFELRQCAPPEYRLTEYVGGYYCALCGTPARMWPTNGPGTVRALWDCEDGCDAPLPRRLRNAPLFELLEELTEELYEEEAEG